MLCLQCWRCFISHRLGDAKWHMKQIHLKWQSFSVQSVIFLLCIEQHAGYFKPHQHIIFVYISTAFFFCTKCNYNFCDGGGSDGGSCELRSALKKNIAEKCHHARGRGRWQARGGKFRYEVSSTVNWAERLIEVQSGQRERDVYFHHKQWKRDEGTIPLVNLCGSNTLTITIGLETDITELTGTMCDAVWLILLKGRPESRRWSG